MASCVSVGTDNCWKYRHVSLYSLHSIYGINLRKIFHVSWNKRMSQRGFFFSEQDLKNSYPSCLSLPSNEITCVHHHTQVFLAGLCRGAEDWSVRISKPRTFSFLSSRLTLILEDVSQLPAYSELGMWPFEGLQNIPAWNTEDLWDFLRQHFSVWPWLS
jgi:hypothetical protein